MGKPQIEGLTVPVSCLHGCQNSVILWVKDQLLSSAAPGSMQLGLVLHSNARHTWMTHQYFLKIGSIDECAHELQASLTPMPGSVPCAK